MLLVLVRWLENGGPGHPKHQTHAHAVTMVVILHVLAFATGIWADSQLAAVLLEKDKVMPAAPRAALGLAVYWVLFATARFVDEKPWGRVGSTYGLAWSCNATLLFAAAAIWLRRPALVCACGMLVAIDQVLWYVDFAGYLLTGKFVINVCGYLFWPSTTFVKRISAVHHLAFVPLVVVLCCRGGHGVPIVRGFLISLAQAVTIASWCRFTTPHVLQEPGQAEPRYMNLNLCYENFKGVKFPRWILEAVGPRAHRWLPGLIFFWTAGSLLFFALFAGVLIAALRLLTALPGTHFAF